MLDELGFDSFNAEQRANSGTIVTTCRFMIVSGPTVNTLRLGRSRRKNSKPALSTDDPA